MTAELRAAALAYIEAKKEPAYSLVHEAQRARATGTPNREVARIDRVSAAYREMVALASTPEPATVAEGLDVERLARAICAEDESIESDPVNFDDCEDRADHIDYAQAIAREYAASPSPEE